MRSTWLLLCANAAVATVNYSTGNNNFTIPLLAVNGVNISYSLHAGYNSRITTGTDYDYLSNLPFESATNSIIDRKGTSSNLIVVNGKEYKKGIGTTANASIIYNIQSKGYSHFFSVVGLDDTCVSGNLTFEIYDSRTANIPRYSSGLICKGQYKHFDIDISGWSVLKLVVKDGTTGEYGAWAGARLFQTRPQCASWVGLGIDLDVPYIERFRNGGPDNCSGHTTNYGDSLFYGVEKIDSLRVKVASSPTAKLYFDFYNYLPLNFIRNDFEKKFNSYHESARNMLFFPRPHIDLPSYNLNDTVVFGGPNYTECSWLNNQTQQDYYILSNFPKGNKQIFFAKYTKDTVIGGQVYKSILQPQFAPYAPWKISLSRDTTYNGGEINEWVIIDDDGTRYTFGGRTASGIDARVVVDSPSKTGKDFDIAKFTYKVESSGQNNRHLSTVIENPEYDQSVERWYLTKMESYDGNQIKFDYKQVLDPAPMIEKPYIGAISKWQTPPAPRCIINISLGTPGFGIYEGVDCFLDIYYYGSHFPNHRVPFTPVCTTNNSQNNSIEIKRTLIFPAERRIEKIELNGILRSVSDQNIILQLDSCERIIPPNEQVIGNDQALYIECVVSNIFQTTCGNYPITLNRIDPNAPNDYYIQSVVYDDTRKYKRTVYPTIIESDVEKIEFLTDTVIPRIDNDKYSRPRLSAVIKKVKKNGVFVDAEKTIFDHTYYYSRLLLSIVRNEKCGEAGGTKKLYTLRYDEGTPITQTDDFGFINIGLLTSVTDIYGKQTRYYYSPGSYEYLSNNQHITTGNAGNVVSRIVKDGQIPGNPMIETILTHFNGEAQYSDALKESSTDSWFYCGLSGTKNLIKYATDWAGKYRFALKNGISYRSVKVITANEGSKTYHYLHSGSTENGVELKDDENEYHVKAMYRNNLKIVTDSSTDGKELTKTIYTYDVKDYSLGSADSQQFYYKKPTTFIQQFELNRVCDSSIMRNYYFIQMPEDNFNNSGQIGLREAITVKTMSSNVKMVETYYNGVRSVITYEYNNKGYLEKEINLNGENSICKRLQYAYEVHNNSIVPKTFFENNNILTPVVSTLMSKYSESAHTPTTVLRANKSVWNGTANKVYPWRSYNWIVKGTDNNGNPSPAYQDTFDWNLQTNPSWWLLKGESSLRNSSGMVLETKGPVVNNQLTSSTIYRNDNHLPIATVSNSGYKECAILTSDYYGNDWIGNANITANTAHLHFGKQSYKVDNNWGPVRDIDSTNWDKSYELSAWVYPIDVSSTKPIQLIIEKWRALDSCLGGVYAVFYPGKDLVAGQWNLIKLRITANDMKDIKALQASTKHLRIAVSPVPTGPNSTFIAGQSAVFAVDEIRFSPADAQVATIFYDDRNRPICAVDANNSAKYTEYDNWDRIYKVYNNKHQLLSKAEYKLAGDLP